MNEWSLGVQFDWMQSKETQYWQFWFQSRSPSRSHITVNWYSSFWPVSSFHGYYIRRYNSDKDKILPTFRIANVDDILSVFSSSTQLTFYHKSIPNTSFMSVVLAQRSIVYSLVSDVLIKQLNELIQSYELAVNYYQMELSSLFLPSDYLMMRRSY